MGYSLPSSHTAAAVERIERHGADAGTERFGLLDAQFGQYGIALSLRSALLVPVGLSMSDQMQFHDVQRWLRMRATASCQPAYWRLRQSALRCGVKARSSCHFAAIASSDRRRPGEALPCKLRQVRWFRDRRAMYFCIEHVCQFLQDVVVFTIPPSTRRARELCAIRCDSLNQIFV